MPDGLTACCSACSLRMQGPDGAVCVQLACDRCGKQAELTQDMAQGPGKQAVCRPCAAVQCTNCHLPWSFEAQVWLARSLHGLARLPPLLPTPSQPAEASGDLVQSSIPKLPASVLQQPCRQCGQVVMQAPHALTAALMLAGSYGACFQQRPGHSEERGLHACGPSAVNPCGPVQ